MRDNLVLAVQRQRLIREGKLRAVVCNFNLIIAMIIIVIVIMITIIVIICCIIITMLIILREGKLRAVVCFFPFDHYHNICHCVY